MEVLNKGRLEKVEAKIGKEKARNPRQFVVDLFVEKINEDRRAIEQALYTTAYISARLSRAGVKSIDDMYWFLGKCNEYVKRGSGTFSRCFFGSIKIKQ